MTTWIRPVSDQYTRFCAVREISNGSTLTHCGGRWPTETPVLIGTDPLKCPACVSRMPPRVTP